MITFTSYWVANSRTISSQETWTYPEILGARRQVPLLDQRLVPQIFLDNAASTKPFRVVSDFLQQIQLYYSNIHRGTGFDSIFCTERYEEARHIIGEFVGWDAERDVAIPIRNTTEGINLLANTIPFAPGDRVLVTLLEHHSNDLPWRTKAEVEHLPVNLEGQLDLQALASRLQAANGKIRVVSVTGASNVTGTVLPIHEIATIAHQHGAWVVVDAAQLVPHRRVQMQPHSDPSHIDFLVFSGHKMNCPWGIGAVVGRRDLFEQVSPYQPGGGTVHSVSLDRVLWAEAPERNEAGTPNILGLLALARTIQVLESVGMEAIEAHEKRLTHLLLQGLAQIPQVTILGASDPQVGSDRLGVVSFRVQGVHQALVAAILSYEWGIAVRHGCFCAHPLVKHLLNITKEQEQQFEAEILQGDRRTIPGAVRTSLGLHNTEQDIQTLVEAVAGIAQGQWQGNYEQDAATGEFYPQGFRFDFAALPGFSTASSDQGVPESSWRLPNRLATIIGSCLMAVSLGTGGWWIAHHDRLPSVRTQPLAAAANSPALSQTLSPMTIVPVKAQAALGARSLTGTVEPVESVTLTSRVMGQITHLSVKEGDVVAAGQVLAVIDVKDIRAQHNQAVAGIQQAQATVAVAHANALTAQSQFAQARARYTEAQAKLIEAQAELSDAQTNQRRTAQLKAQGAISQSRLDEADTHVAVIQARMKQIQASMQQSQAAIKQARAQVQQTQAQIQQAKAQVQQAQSGADQVMVNLNYGTVTAPFPGVVTRKYTEVGAIAGPGQPLITLENQNRLRFSVAVPVSLVSQLKQGQIVQVQLDSLPHPVSGRVDQIIPSANPISRDVTVKIALEVPPGVIPGMFGRLQLTSSDRQALTVPLDGLVKRMGITGVFKVVEGKTQFQPITTGDTYGETVEVFSGVKSGEQIIRHPDPNLQENTAL